MNDEQHPPHTEEPSTEESVPPQENLPTRLYRGFDKTLNIVLLVLGGLWLVSWFFSDKIPAPQTLAQEAAQVFATVEPTTSSTHSAVSYQAPAQDYDLIRPMRVVDFEALLATSHQKPFFLMVYASWCPHCKRLFKELNAAASTYGDAWQFATVSIDDTPQDTTQFLSTQTPIHLTSYIMEDKATYRHIGDAMRALELDFKGGIAPSVAVPYNVIFYKGEPIAEFQGAMPTEDLRNILTEITEKATTHTQ